MSNAKIPSTGGQNARLGLIIANGVIDAIDGHFSSIEMQEVLKNETLIRNFSSRIVSELFSLPIDPWVNEKKKISRFYKSIFNYTIDWSNVKLPDYSYDYSRLEYVDSGIDWNLYISAFKKKFGNDSVEISACYRDFIDNGELLLIQQDRPKDDYCFAWSGISCPSSNHLNKSYYNFCNQGVNFLIAKEGIIAYFRSKFELNSVSFAKGTTIFHSAEIESMCMQIYENKLILGEIPKERCMYDSGPCEIKLA